MAVDLNDLSPSALSAAMRGGTAGWGQHGSVEHVRYAQPTPARSRRRCQCGCQTRATQVGMANGVALMCGCELAVARWIKDPTEHARNQMRRRHAERNDGAGLGRHPQRQQRLPR